MALKHQRNMTKVTNSKTNNWGEVDFQNCMVDTVLSDDFLPRKIATCKAWEHSASENVALSQQNHVPTTTFLCKDQGGTEPIS